MARHVVPMDAKLALKAILSRLDGNFDCPALLLFGPLSDSVEGDCREIAECALRAVGSPAP